MKLPVDYNTPVKDNTGKWHLCRPVLVSVSGGKNVAYVTEAGTEIKREPVHRYKNRIYRRKDGIATALREKYGTGEPIFAEDLDKYELRVMNNLFIKGKVRVFDNNVFYFPKFVTVGGVTHELSVRADKIIERRYITDGIDVYGYISGHTLRNYAGLTRQVPYFIEITTNAETENTRDFTVGNRRVITHRSPIEITKENVGTLQFLDSLVLSEPDHLDEISLYIFQEWLDEQYIDYSKLKTYVKYFPNHVAANLEKKVIKDEITRRYRNIQKAD